MTETFSKPCCRKDSQPLLVGLSAPVRPLFVRRCPPGLKNGSLPAALNGYFPHRAGQAPPERLRKKLGPFRKPFPGPPRKVGHLSGYYSRGYPPEFRTLSVGQKSQHRAGAGHVPGMPPQAPVRNYAPGAGRAVCRNTGGCGPEKSLPAFAFHRTSGLSPCLHELPLPQGLPRRDGRTASQHLFPRSGVALVARLDLRCGNLNGYTFPGVLKIGFRGL